MEILAKYAKRFLGMNQDPAGTSARLGVAFSSLFLACRRSMDPARLPGIV